VITVKPYVVPAVVYTAQMSSGLGATSARGGTMASARAAAPRGLGSSKAYGCLRMPDACCSGGIAKFAGRRRLRIHLQD
jgi:hypothetical protein